MFNKYKHRRHSIRLKKYDYSQTGWYFITICTHDRICLFGDIVNGEMWLNKYGNMVQTCWNDLPNHYKNIKLDSFVIMPNHVHGIIMITNNPSINDVGLEVGAGLKPAPTNTRKSFYKHLA